jgi:hypothetical protein
MKTTAEKRACERHRYAADIAFSYFNKEHSYDAQTLNLCTGGMCFKTNLFLKPGATVYIRLKNSHSSGSFCEGLHLATLAEVKWCHETPTSGVFPYGVGVKYFEAVY